MASRCRRRRDADLRRGRRNADPRGGPALRRPHDDTAQDVEIRGHRAALWGASWQTPDLIAEYGLSYDSSLMGDDRPYRIATDSGPIVELPVHWSLDDWEAIRLPS
jgi:hypothetical protein